MHGVPPCGNDLRTPCPAKHLAQEAGRPSGLAENCSPEPFIESLTYLRNTVQNRSLPARESITLGHETIESNQRYFGIRIKDDESWRNC
jgi:hypothetical protein